MVPLQMYKTNASFLHIWFPGSVRESTQEPCGSGTLEAEPLLGYLARRWAPGLFSALMEGESQVFVPF